MVVELAEHAGLGVVLGIVTGIPLGLLNVAVVEGAARSGFGRGVGIGAGGAVADFVHAFLGFAGVGALVAGHPVAAPVLWCLSGIGIGIYGLLLLRRSGLQAVDGLTVGRDRAGFMVGMAITLPNPSALGAWVVVGALLGPFDYAVAGVVAGGVSAGSFLWLTALAWLAGRGGRRAPRVRGRWLTTGAGLVLIGFALFALVRAGLGFLSLAD